MSASTVVIPCYDEAKRLDAGRIGAFLHAERDVALVLVDDGSRDGTLALLRDLAAKHPGRVDVLALERNRGKAEAVRRGVLHALGRAPDYVGYWDADLATPLELIPAFARLLDERPELELVMGARVALLGHAISRRLSRHYVGRVGATLISLVLGFPVYDTQCGAKLLRAGPLAERLFAQPFLAGWTFDVELLARVARDRAARGLPSVASALYEYPLPAWRDVPGSKIGGLDYLRAGRELWRIHRRYHPRALRRGAR